MSLLPIEKRTWEWKKMIIKNKIHAQTPHSCFIGTYANKIDIKLEWLFMLQGEEWEKRK